MLDVTPVAASPELHPPLIMGCDSFLSFCAQEPRPPHMLTEKYAHAVMRCAADLGVRAFDFSFRAQVMRAIARIRDRFPETVCLANLNWRCGVMLGNQHLIDVRARVISTLFKQVLSRQFQESALSLPYSDFSRWFGDMAPAKPLSLRERKSIHLDEQAFGQRVAAARDLAEFLLIGTDIGDWLIALDRSDIVARMCDIGNQNGLSPVAITHWPALTLPYIRHLPFVAAWCMLNSRLHLPSRQTVLSSLKAYGGPVVAFGILKGWTGSRRHMTSAVREALRLPHVVGTALGLSTVDEARETIPMALRQIRLSRRQSLVEGPL